MNVMIIGYDKVKYLPDSEKTFEVAYKSIKGFEVVTGDRATEIGNETDEASRDEYNEYLIVTLEDGDTATFRNSHCEIFRY